MNQNRRRQERPLARKLTVLFVLGVVVSILAACARSVPPESGAAEPATAVAQPPLTRQQLNILVGSCYTSNVLKFDATTGAFLGEFIQAHAGGLDCPEGEVALGQDGSLYLTSFSPPRLEQPETGGVTNDQVLRFDAKTGAYKDVFIAPSRELVGPHGLALDRNGKLLVGTRFNSSVLGRSTASTSQTNQTNLVITGTQYGIRDVSDIAYGPDGNLYVSSYATGDIFRFDPQGQQFLGRFISGQAAGLSHVHDLLFGPDGNLYVTNHNGTVAELYESSQIGANDRNTVVRFDGRTGQSLGTFISGQNPTLGFIGDIAFGPEGNLFVVDCQQASVIEFNGKTGALVDTLVQPKSGGLSGATFILFQPK